MKSPRISASVSIRSEGMIYYVTEAYRSYLDNPKELSLETELDCRDLFNSKDEKDRLIVYKYSYET